MAHISIKTLSPKLRMLLAATVVSVLGQSLSAEGFRIETKVYFGEDERPQTETTTLFLDGVVYDFVAKPAQAAVFRKPTGGRPGQFILLQTEERIQTKLSTAQLAGAMDKLRNWASRQSDPFLKFAADPQFEESFEPQSSRLVLAHHLESYTVTTAPAEHARELAEYREFLDWYARLNALLSTDHFPPEPRLQLNAALARHQVIPLKVELTRAGVSDPLRAEHQFMWRLSREDSERIDQAREWLASYREVTNAEYVRTVRVDKPAE